MKHILILITILILGSVFFGCNQTDNTAAAPTEEKSTTSSEDKEQIQDLIRKVLNWSNSKNSIELLPLIADSKDSLYKSFDIGLHKQNLDKLKKTNLFATEFIENYNQLILTLDKGLKSGVFDQWYIGELPTFNFASEVNPWTLNQDVPFDNPNPYDFVEVEIVNIGKGEVNWKWGKPELITSQTWKDFNYNFRVVKENDQWKIAYLKGFDFKESTK